MRPHSPDTARLWLIQQTEARLRAFSLPRLQMLLLVSLTGAFGLLASFSLLSLGLGSMALRYPLALALAYGFFLCLLWLWLRTQPSDYVDVPDLSGLVPDGRTSCDAAGAGGHFGGGGASGSFDAPSPVGGSDVGDASLDAVSKAVGSVGDADELAIPLIVAVLAAGLALASLYVVYIAPALFAEVLVDGALSYLLLRRLRADDQPFWLAGAVRHTAVPFALTAVFVALMGAAMSAYAPGAQSIGQVIAALSAR